MEWNPRTSWHEVQGSRQKARRPPIICGDRGAKDWPFGRATSLPSLCGTCVERNRHDPDIAEGFAEDLYQEGDLYCRARQEDPAAPNEVVSTYWRIWGREGVCDEGRNRGGVRGTAGHALHAHGSDDDDRDMDVSRVTEPTVLPLGLVAPGLGEQLCYLSQRLQTLLAWGSRNDRRVRGNVQRVQRPSSIAK